MNSLQVVETEQARARRLSRWMKISFACAALAIVILIVFPVVAYPLVSQAGPTPAPRNGGKMIAAMTMSVFWFRFRHF